MHEKDKNVGEGNQKKIFFFQQPEWGGQEREGGADEEGEVDAKDGRSGGAGQYKYKYKRQITNKV